jgi:Xaa-Pro aminopeptidase
LNVAGKVGLAAARSAAPGNAALGRTAALEPADDLIAAIAREKSAEELAVVRHCAAAADAGFEAFRTASRVGVREYEIVAEVEYAMRLAGADDNFILMASGPHNTAMRAPTDRRVAPGDVVIGEITPVCAGQFIQLCRTVSVGEPSAALVDAYDLLMRAYDAAVRKPERTCPRRSSRPRSTASLAARASPNTAGRRTCGRAATGSASGRSRQAR